MKIIKVGKLFFGRFPYKVCFQRQEHITDPNYHNGWTIFNCKTWLEENAIEYRMYNQILKNTKKSGRKSKKQAMVKGCLFLMTRQDVDSVLEKWPTSVDAIEEPFDETHIDILKENTRTIIRTRLMYGRYRHVVKFRRIWNETASDINEWISDNLDMSDDNMKWRKDRWNPTLYLISEADLFLVKMAWQDRISEILTILTVNDL